ncbi:vegetative cell wall protein gp1-like [Actinidia eriantha]|uniref:vegetative cell wall protein gp1-like n=1 Tax=Actinidia eriantha TaxID=165200 RepID=UPI002584BEF4|nr:vegetative cell wall protein gp1-like [Actinidia eriantha]
MARLHNLSTIALLALLTVRIAVSADPPSPPPELGGDSLAPPPSPSPPPELSSPPAPPPSDLAPGSSPSPAKSPSKESPAPVPLPENPSDISSDRSEVNDVSAKEKESSGGMKGGEKAGIVFGVIAGACLVGFGGMVYKKRQDNIRRSQYGYAARTQFL